VEQSMMEYSHELQVAEPERLPLFSILVGLFVLATVSVSELSVWNYIVKAVGLVLAIGYAVRWLQARIRTAPEVILYAAWATWSLVALLGGAQPVLFWDRFLTVVQIWFLLLIVAGFTTSLKTLSFSMGMFLVGVAIVGAWSLATGEYRRAETGTHRVEGLAVNANTFGWLMFLGTVCMAYFWMIPTRLKTAKWVILGAGMAAAGLATILSGSRKSVLALPVFFVLWIWFSYRKVAFRRPAVLLGILLAFVVGGYGFLRAMSGTDIEDRFRSTMVLLSGGHTRSGGGERITIYREGLAMAAQHPLLGVGLNNFLAYSRDLSSSHSEYLSILCETGVPGVVLYFAIFVLLWRRAGKIAKFSTDPTEVRVAQLIRAMLVVVMLLNFGRWNYCIKTAWLIFGSAIGYTNSVWQRIRSQATYPEEFDEYALAEPHAAGAP
jgi:O-antigen ligase